MMKRVAMIGLMIVGTAILPLSGKAEIGLRTGAGFLTVYNLDAVEGIGAASFGADVNLEYSLIKFLSIAVPLKFAFGDINWMLVGGGIKLSYPLGDFVPALSINGGLCHSSVEFMGVEESSNDPYFGVGVALPYFFTELIGAGLNLDFDFVFGEETAKLLTISVGPILKF